MATPVAGVISLNDVRRELEIPSSSISMGQYETRALCGVMSGAISMSDLYNKRYKENNRHLFTSRVWGGGSEGGTFDLRRWGFTEGMEITHCQFWASKYENSLFFYHFGITFEHAGILHYLPSPLKCTSGYDTRIEIPKTADHHDTNYFGYIIYPDGLNKNK